MPAILPSVSDMTRLLGCSVLFATAAAAQLYTIETIAGGGDGVGDDGPAIRAKLTEPTGVAVDAAGNIYIADRHNHRVRKVNTSGTISTFAGTSVGTRDYGFNGDGGPADRALLAFPEGVVVDVVGNVYIGDTDNHRIRMVDTAGIIHTIAGSGERGFGGDGGPAIRALLSEPSGVAVDSVGNVYIADTDNHRIRMVDTAGIIHTIAGTGEGGFSGDGGLAIESDLFRPLDVAVDAVGNIYIADFTRISKVDISGRIRTFGGTGRVETGGNVFAPRGVAVDAVGNVYFTNPSLPGIRKVDVSGAISTVVELVEEDNLPRGLAVDASGIVYITDIIDFRVYKVDASGALTTIAGLGVGDYSGDGGPATKVKLGHPENLAVDGTGNVYIQDFSRIRKVDTSGIIDTIAGGREKGVGGDGGPAAGTFLDQPRGVAVDATGNIYIAEWGRHRIRKVDTLGVIHTIAGSGESGFSGDGGPATSAMLAFPLGVAVDAVGNVYIADALNHRIRRIDILGVIETIAGSGDGVSEENFTGDYGGDSGPATGALLARPGDIAVDDMGNVYIADAFNHRIRKVDASGIIDTIAGTGERGFGGDGGPATSALLAFPQGVATDGAGNLYIADAGNNRIRKVDSTGTITTIAGTGGIGFDGRGFGGDGGSATSALLASPGGVALDSAGNLYIADTGNHRIRKLTPGVTLEPVVSAVVNAGSYSRNAAAGAIMSLFGTDLAPGTAFTASSPLPVTLQGTTVTVIGSGGVTREAGLFFVSAGQINFLIPAATPTGTASVSVAASGPHSQGFAVQIGNVAPGLFSANASGKGVAAAEALRIQGDGSRIREDVITFDPASSSYQAVPLDLGIEQDQVFLILYGTGIRGVSAGGVSVTIGGEAVAVQYAGLQGDFVGLDQVNLGPLPRSLSGRGEVSVVLTADGVPSNALTITFQ